MHWVKLYSTSKRWNSVCFPKVLGAAVAPQKRWTSNEIINCLWLVWIHSREYVVLEGHLLISSDPPELGQCWATLGPELLQSQHWNGRMIKRSKSAQCWPQHGPERALLAGWVLSVGSFSACLSGGHQLEDVVWNPSNCAICVKTEHDQRHFPCGFLDLLWFIHWEGHWT